MQMVFDLQQQPFCFVLCVGFTAAHEVPAMPNAAETHGHGQPLLQNPSSVQPGSDGL